MRVAAVVLAAGASTRLGQPKQLLVSGGETLVERAVRSAREAGCDRVLVVAGAVALTSSAEVVLNRHWQDGIGSSIRCGVRHVMAHQSAADALLLLTCDQPKIDAMLLRTLLQSWERSGQPIVASSYADAVGIPALFARPFWDELLRLPDDSGAKPVIAADAARVATVPFPGGELDIDTPADLERLR
jgi:molybdenum cofactor cytidylyltransferase